MWCCLLGPYAFMCSQLGHYWREKNKNQLVLKQGTYWTPSHPPSEKKVKLSLTDSKNAFSQICSQFLQRALCLFSGRNPRQLKTRRHLRRMRLLSRVDPAPSRAFPAWTLKLFCLQTQPSSTQHIHWQTLTLTPGRLTVSTPVRWPCLPSAWHGSSPLPQVPAVLYSEQPTVTCRHFDPASIYIFSKPEYLLKPGDQAFGLEMLISYMGHILFHEKFTKRSCIAAYWLFLLSVTALLPLLNGTTKYGPQKASETQGNNHFQIT